MLRTRAMQRIAAAMRLLRRRDAGADAHTHHPLLLLSRPPAGVALLSARRAVVTVTGLGLAPRKGSAATAGSDSSRQASASAAAAAAAAPASARGRGKRKTTSAKSIAAAAAAAAVAATTAAAALPTPRTPPPAADTAASSRAHRQLQRQQQKQRQQQQFRQFQLWQREQEKLAQQKKMAGRGGGGGGMAGSELRHTPKSHNTLHGGADAQAFAEGDDDVHAGDGDEGAVGADTAIHAWTRAERSAAPRTRQMRRGAVAEVNEADEVNLAAEVLDEADEGGMPTMTAAEEEAVTDAARGDGLDDAEGMAELGEHDETGAGAASAAMAEDGIHADAEPEEGAAANDSGEGATEASGGGGEEEGCGDGNAATAAAAAAPSSNAPAVGSLLDHESPLNLRLATLTRHSGKAFRAIAVHLPQDRSSMNFAITFEDVASGARLVCKLDEVKTLYVEWVTQFRAAFVALFLPTLQHPNATLLQNAIQTARPPRPLPPPGSYHPRLNEEPDHLFFSYTKLREVVSQKKRDMELSTQLLTVTVLNAYAEEWKNFISAPFSCVPQSFLQAAFNFHPSQNAILNKDLLHAQLTAAAEALLSRSPKKGGGTAAGHHHRGTSRPESWSLIFVSAPARTSVGVSAIPPMQDLLTGQFVEPLSLSERYVIYIIGSGGAAQSFAQFPVARKGAVAFSILLRDIESQLQLPTSERRSLTVLLAHSVDAFSRMTWMSLMQVETGALRVPHPPNAFYRLQRRQVQHELVPSFLESVFAPSHQLMSGLSRGAGAARAVGAVGGGGGGLAGVGGTGGGSARAAVRGAQTSRLVEEHIRLIYNNPDRLEREQTLRDQMRNRRALFVNISTASVTAARRADNPFSRRNGIVDASGQLWTSLTLPNPPPMLHLQADLDASGATRDFVNPDDVLPPELPTQPRDHADPSARAENVVLIAWDVKRVALFLRESPRLREFLHHGGKIWCAQYAQYLLKGFNHVNLATMERTLLQYHDGPLKAAMHPLAKLKLIYETQLEVAVNTRQLNSILHRMDGLLASIEMEVNGLQLAPQGEISRFANTLRLDHERLEKVLQEKILDFTKGLDDDVRQRINFRSPQDISTIIYGGGLCRHLGSRFVPVRPTKYPITALLPHAVCQATGTPTPEAYVTAESLLGTFQSSATSTGMNFTSSDVERTLRHIQGLTRGATLDALVASTAVVVVIARAKLGGLLEQLSVYVPSATESTEAEVNTRVAIDEILPVTDRPDIVPVGQLKALLSAYPPLRRLREQLQAAHESAQLDAASAATNATATAASAAATSGGGGGGRRRGGAHGSGSGKGSRTSKAPGAPADLRNLLIITNCSHERLEPIVDTGVVATIARAVLGEAAGPGTDERPPFERVCFADLSKAFPAAPHTPDASFESDFSELSTNTKVAFSARANWEAQTRELIGVGGVDGVVRAMASHCASMLGTPRDAFRNTHPVPTVAPQGLHGQEQASTPGMLWMVTPPSLHPVLRRFLRGRSASSGADAMERVTVFLSPYKNIDLSFFSALQQLRYTEKKLQLFEEGALFRAVLPECGDRVHGELCHCVTATGRLSSQSPNLQNIPREEDLRTLIRSRFGAEGRMIEADYSQLEVVVLAALSRDPRMMQELRDQVDFHCLRVSLMTKEPYEDVVRKAKVEKDPQYIQLRQQAKVFSFQRQYGAGVATIATTTGLTEQEVDRLIAAEEQHYRELGRYYRLVMDCVDAGSDRLLRLRTLDTAMWNANMRRVVMLTEPLYYFATVTGSKFDFAKDRKSIPRLKNYPVQGLAGEIVQIICGKIVRLFYQKHRYGDKAFLVNTVHDCVWVDAHESVAEEVQRDLRELMGSTQQIIGDLWPEMGLDVPFRAEIHSGTTLGELST